MEHQLQKYYGIHPGRVLERVLSERQLKKGPFAISIGEYPQVINEITKARRGISPMLAIKIDHALGLEEGEFYLLQAHYDIDQVRVKLQQKEIPSFRKILFWDTDIDKIDWQKQYKAVIRRVFERGSDDEKRLALAFYGRDKIKEVTGSDGIEGNSIIVMGHAKKR